MCSDNTVKTFQPLATARRKEARDSLNNMVLHTSPRVVKVDGFDADVKIEGVLVEENRPARKNGSREVVHEGFRVRHSQKLFAR